MHAAFRLRWMLTTLFAVTVSFGALQPRTALAAEDTQVLASYGAVGPVYVEESVAFFVQVLNSNVEIQQITSTVTFPASAAFVSYTSSGACTANFSIVGTTVTIVNEVAAGAPCFNSIFVSFSQPGDYGAGDTTLSATTSSPNGVTALLNPNVTILALEVEEPEAPAVCELTPDLAVSPQFISLAPGGRATVEIAMRNLCKDAPSKIGDLLVSFSDSLTVVNTSDNWLNLGQRASLQTFTLNPDETRTWAVTVQAADQLVAAPAHVTEYYVSGAVASRIDGVFITPAPAPVVAAAPVVVAPAAPAPIPASLPNTSAAASLLPQLLTALAAAAAGVALRRRG